MLGNELLEKLRSYDWGESRLALTEVTDAINKTHGNKEELANIEKALLGVLESDAKQAGKQFICRQLSIIGTENSVPTLAKMLTDETSCDMARYALQQIPGSTVDKALRNALPKTTGKTKVGIINSLGERGDIQAVPTLEKLMMFDSDMMVIEAAISALGKIAGPEATKALEKAKDKVHDKLKVVALDAYLKCADKLVAEGKKNQALAIYKELQKEDLPKPIRTAAVRGMINATKKSGKNGNQIHHL